MESKSICVCKALGIGDQPIPDVVIAIAKDIDDGLSLDDSQKLFEEQAESIANVLWGSLPGGTLDRLVAKLMSRKASLLIVPYSSRVEPDV